jgi:hypothetical protein
MSERKPVTPTPESNGVENKMNVFDMPLEWQQRSANTFAMPMPIRRTTYFQWLSERDLPIEAAEVAANAGSTQRVTNASTADSMVVSASRPR